MNYIALTLACILIPSAAIAAEKSPTKSKAAATTPKTAVKPWKPTAFVQTTDHLPARYYNGQDPIKFLNMFTSKVEGVKKGKFETSEEFAKRTANKDDILAPINTSDLYAFRIILHSKYDADTQAYTFDGSCHETSDGVWVTCTVDNTARKNDTYIGSNAFGASLTVQRERGLDIALAFHYDNPIIKTVLSSTGDGELAYQGKVFVPLEKARNIDEASNAIPSWLSPKDAALSAEINQLYRTYAGAGISALFVGHIADAKIIERLEFHNEPTIDTPMDTIIIEKAIPFDLKEIIYYVDRTGEILGKEDMNQ